jgi:multiple sugar transport system substrate-binding protein
MAKLTRRSLLRNSFGLVAGGTIARPYLANAAAKTATVWWVQGFIEEEDVAFKNTVSDYEKASGNKIDYTIIPFAPQRQKIVSAMTSGVVPDLFPNNPVEILALYAWDNKLVDVSDIVETQKSQYSETALLSAFCYNSVEKRRSYYAVPYTCAVRPNHVWRPLVEKAGYKIEDAPKTWDAYYDFFEEVQKSLRLQGMRNVYGMGFQLNTTGNDSNALFDYFLIAYGGKDIVTKDGKLHVDDPRVKEAAIKTVTYPTAAYKEGFVPPGGLCHGNDQCTHCEPGLVMCHVAATAPCHCAVASARSFRSVVRETEGLGPRANHTLRRRQLGQRVRCRGCGVRGRTVVSIKWGARADEPRLPLAQMSARD